MEIRGLKLKTQNQTNQWVVTKRSGLATTASTCLLSGLVGARTRDSITPQTLAPMHVMPLLVSSWLNL
jgi:hypothetical protein